MWGSQVPEVAESTLELGCCNSKARVSPHLHPICLATFLLHPPLTSPGTISTSSSHPIASRARTMSHVSLVLILEVKVIYRSHVTASPQPFSSLSNWSQHCGAKLWKVWVLTVGSPGDLDRQTFMICAPLPG